MQVLRSTTGDPDVFSGEIVLARLNHRQVVIGCSHVVLNVVLDYAQVSELIPRAVEILKGRERLIDGVYEGEFVEPLRLLRARATGVDKTALLSVC